MATGWNRLGEALAGGGRGQAYENRLGQLLVMGNRDQQLRQAVMENTARAGIRGRLEGAGYDPAQAALGEYLMQGGLGSDYANFTQGLGRTQEQEFRRGSVDAAQAGDWGGANAQLMGVASGPVDVTKLSDGVAYNRLVEPGLGDMIVTPVGEATIGQRNAAAGASNAAATATMGRLGIAQQQFDLQRSGRWNPGGSSSASGPEGRQALADQYGLEGAERTRYVLTGALPASFGAAAETVDPGDITATFNDRQRAGAAMQREALLNQVATQTGTRREEVNRILEAEGPGGVARLLRERGRRFFQGPILGEIPFLSERVNRDITPFGESAARGQAMINDPAGPITNPDVEGARSMVPSIRQPIGVQANLVESMLRMSGGGAAARPGLPAQQRAEPNQRAIQALMNNPGLSAQFDAKYGDGAAAAYLGQ